MDSEIFNQKKILIIAGLHRSGTTPLFNILKSHDNISGFEETGYPKDEGQFLQSVYPIAKTYGGPGVFGFSKEMHMIEESESEINEKRNKILSEWASYWDLSKDVLMEKSPPNILKLRFLQALFPEAYFIVIIRDPIAVSYATQKWSKTNVFQLLEHWIHSHQIYKKDKKYINRLLELRYENLCVNLENNLKKISEFLDVKMNFDPNIRFEDYNDKYLDIWQDEFHVLNQNILNYIKLQLINRKIKPFGYNILK